MAKINRIGFAVGEQYDKFDLTLTVGIVLACVGTVLAAIGDLGRDKAALWIEPDKIDIGIPEENKDK